MSGEEFARTEMLLGAEALEKLSRSSVALFGVGGVGGYVAEALARCGVGRITLFDADTVSLSNINRQIIATHGTVGRYKTEVMRERILDINPDAKVECFNIFYLPENADLYPFDGYDYIVDAVDTVTAKLEIIRRAFSCGVPMISVMGTGNKTDPTRFEVSEIEKTSVCPLARVMRCELKKRGIRGLRVVYSKEEPKRHGTCPDGEKPVPASIAFVPPVAGLLAAREVVFGLIDRKTK